MTATLTEARNNLSLLWDKATQDREIIILQRRGAEDVALIALSELASLLETAHLLRSPANAERLLTALQRSRERTTPAQTLDDLKTEMGLGEDAEKSA